MDVNVAPVLMSTFPVRNGIARAASAPSTPELHVISRVPQYKERPKVHDCTDKNITRTAVNEVMTA
jgi:hypothetical protein